MHFLFKYIEEVGSDVLGLTFSGAVSQTVSTQLKHAHLCIFITPIYMLDYTC